MKNFFLLLFILSMSCKSSYDSIFVEEIPDDLLEDEHRYDRDNKVYTVGREFLFKFSLSKGDSILHSDVDHIKLRVLGTTKPFSRFSPDYSQTVIEYLYFDKNNKLLSEEKTGVIENNKNIWIHPPRTLDAGILQLSAFPYIKFEDFNNWKWKLQASFEEYQKVLLKHSYTKGGIIEYNSNSNIGKLPCQVINGTTKSEIGITESYLLFNENYGFVHLEFLNIDGSKITLALIK